LRGGADGELHWLLDTNVIIDFLAGVACYTIIEALGSSGRRHCSTLLVKSDLYLHAARDKELKNSIQRRVTLYVSNIAGKLRGHNVRLVVSSKTVEEVRNTIRRLVEATKGMSKVFGSRYVVFLPASYILDYEAAFNELIGSVVSTISVDGMYEKTKSTIEECLGGRYDIRDWHLAAALMADNKIAAAYSEEDSVAKGLRTVSRKCLKRGELPVGGFASFIASLRELNILTREQASLIGYYAYKFRRLPYSHQMACNLQHESQLLTQAIVWIAYSQHRLQQYIPP